MGFKPSIKPCKLFPLTVFNTGLKLIKGNKELTVICLIVMGFFIWGVRVNIRPEDVVCSLSTLILEEPQEEIKKIEEIMVPIEEYFELDVEVTAYTNGPESTGKSPGHPAYGITSSGKSAGWGTIAAPREFPYGVEVEIPGYGRGVVQDRGGAIRWHPEKQKYILDVWMDDVKEARKWGRRNLRVKISRAGLNLEDENRILRRGL